MTILARLTICLTDQSEKLGGWCAASAAGIGRPVFRAMAGDPAAGTQPDYISSDCPIAGRHIQQGMGEAGKGDKQHPISLLRIAYGL